MDTGLRDAWDADRMIGALEGKPAGTLVFDVRYPERLSRLLIFIKWLLVIPQVLVLYILTLVQGVVSFIAWFAILITGQYPEGMWQFSMKVMRWNANVGAYMLFFRDEYPPFSDLPYPLVFEMQRPERLSRLLIFVKWLLIIPHLIALWVLGLVLGVLWFVSFFAILITGKYPRGMFDLAVGIMRWSYRTGVYTNLLTDVYPPFSMDQAG